MDISKIHAAIQAHRYKPLLITSDMWESIKVSGFEEIIFFMQEVKNGIFHDDSFLTLRYALTDASGNIFDIDGQRADFNQRLVKRNIQDEKFHFQYGLDGEVFQGAGIRFGKNNISNEINALFSGTIVNRQKIQPLAVSFLVHQKDDSPYFEIAFDAIYIIGGGGGPAGHQPRII